MLSYLRLFSLFDGGSKRGIMDSKASLASMSRASINDWPIEPVDRSLASQFRTRIDGKAKPLGALGRRPLMPFGVYVHVPFCRERCDYCAFATYTDRDHLMERYADACMRELAQAFGAGDLPAPTSVFFGGGTPSRLHPDTLCRVLDGIPRAPGAEVTVECNPEDADEAHLGAYRRAGVTRVSFGLQSTQAHVLEMDCAGQQIRLIQ